MEQINGTAIGLGICFIISFYLIFDNLALALGIGICMATALHVVTVEEEKQKTNRKWNKRIFPRK